MNLYTYINTNNHIPKNENQNNNLCEICNGMGYNDNVDVVIVNAVCTKILICVPMLKRGRPMGCYQRSSGSFRH